MLLNSCINIGDVIILWLVLQAGYMLHDRILRPAEVGVTIAMDKKDANEEIQT